MKKIMYVLAVTLVIVGLVITNAASTTLSKNTNEYNNKNVDNVDTSMPENADTFLQRLKRLLTGEIIDVDIADTANIASGKINGTGFDADMVDGLHGNQLLRSDTSDTINGDLTVNGELTWQTKTSYVSVSTAAFMPKEDGYDYYNNGAYIHNVDGNSDNYYASVHLPHGATVTNITFYWEDYSTSYNGQLSLNKRTLYAGPQQMALAQTSGNSGKGNSYDNTIEYAVIDNSNNCYYLGLYLYDENIKCYGVIIEYTFTEPY